MNNLFLGGRWAIWVCSFYALMMLIFTLSPGDGSWVLYSQAILKGFRLYEDLHFNQQPLFPIFSTAVTLVAGDWIVFQKIVYFLVPVLYIYLIYLISTYVIEDGLKRGFFIITIFFIAISFEAYRFDDYHAFSGIFILASLYFSIKLLHDKSFLQPYIIWQSLLIAFLLNTRINDGVFLGMAVLFFGIFRLENLKEVFFGFFMTVFFALAILSLNLLILNDTYGAWFSNSILSAASIKGGSALINYPLTMLKKSLLLFLQGDFTRRRLALVLVSGAFFYFSFRNFSKGYLRDVASLISFLGLSYGIFKIYPHHALTFFVALGVLISWGVALLIFVRRAFLRGNSSNFDIFLPLIFYPYFLYCGGSLSSGGSFNDHFFVLALLIIVLLISCKKIVGELDPLKYFVFFIMTILACEAIVLRTIRPYGWHSYNVPSFFEKRYLVTESENGPHLLSKDLAKLILPVCSEIKNSEELLSIPFSFANYYCHKDPWKNYIQTFFDTSSPKQIDRLINDLSISPPEYIFYQRQLENLAVHERIFNHGKPLRQRALDDFLMGKIQSGEWTVVVESDLYPPSRWMLIRTN